MSALEPELARLPWEVTARAFRATLRASAAEGRERVLEDIAAFAPGCSPISTSTPPVSSMTPSWPECCRFSS